MGPACVRLEEGGLKSLAVLFQAQLDFGAFQGYHPTGHVKYPNERYVKLLDYGS